MKHSLKPLLALAFTFTQGVCAHSQATAHGHSNAETGNVSSALPASLVLPELSTSSSSRRVTRYATRFEGDHSLDAMTVDEQVFSRFTLYTVCLQFASGAMQSIAVTAPPGGLQPEMRDMSGDNVPNDVVLSSGLLRLPMIVLLNEGNDHLSLANSLGSFSNGGGRASSSHQIYRAVALRPSGFRSLALTKNESRGLSQPYGDLWSFVPASLSSRFAYANISERAPPLPTVKI